MPQQAQHIIFKKRPQGVLNPEENFEKHDVPRPRESDLKDEEILTEVLYISLDPVMRAWLKGGGNMKLDPGMVMAGWGIMRVLASKAKGVEPGDTGFGMMGWKTHAIVKASDFEKSDVPAGMRLTDTMGVLGLQGLTGHLGMKNVGKPKPGDVVVVSTAAGATGSIAAQTAKNLGAYVVGITGSDEKVRWLKEIGLDEALNYKAADFEERLRSAVPNGINIYFDNVGGSMLELALDNLAMYARVALCGDVSSYDNPNPPGVHNLFELALRRSSLLPVQVFDMMEGAKESREELTKWIREGKLQRTETLVRGTLEKAPELLLDLLSGRNIGKLILDLGVE